VRARRSEARLAVIVLALAAAPARAQVPFPSVVDRVIGVRLDASRTLVADADPGARLECGDMELFGVAGLRLSGARARVRVGGLPAGVELCRLGAPVGSHTRVTGTLGYAAARWHGALRAGVESLALAGAPGESAVVTGLVCGLTLARASLFADVESVADAGGRANYLTVAVAGRVADRAIVLTSMRYDGPGALAAGVAALVPVHRALSLLAGYDDGTETARAGAVIAAGRWSLATGAFRHAVLGMSQGVSVSVTW
jgi:hypothetical protein